MEKFSFKKIVNNAKKTIRFAQDNITPENSSIDEVKEYKDLKEKIEKNNEDYFKDNNAA